MSLLTDAEIVVFLATISTLVALILAGLAAGRLAKRQSDLSFRLAWLGLLLGALGVFLIFHASVKVQAGFDHRRWPETAGVVVSADVEGTRAFHPNVIYEYTIESVTYRDSTDLYQPAFGGRSRRHDVAVKGAAEYVPGSRVTVWYDPGRPSESVIILRVDWSYYAILGLGMILTMGLAAARFILRGSKQALRKQS